MATAQQQAIIVATQGDNVDAGKVVQLCDRCPKNDSFAQHAKGIALLQQGKAAAAKAALEGIDKLEASVAGVNPVAVRFAHAYAYYKLGDFAKTISLLDELTQHAKLGARANADPAVINLLAQAHYNAESYREAAKWFEHILTKQLYRDDVERTELLTNLSAAYSQFDFAKCQEVSRRGIEGDNVTFDAAFNAAAGAIHKKDYPTARKLLAQALGLCLYEHSRDATTTDVVALARQAADPSCPKDVRACVKDASAVMVQQAFVHYATGDEAAAEALLAPLMPLQDVLTVATYATACVNWAALKRHQDFLDTFNRLKYVQRPEVESRLTSRQRLFIKYNTVLLLLGMGGRLAECRKLVDAMIRDVPDSDLGPLALTAVLASKSGSSTRAEDHFRSFMQQRGSEETTFAKLTQAQLALERGNVAAAVEKLKGATALLKSHPSAVATIAHALASKLKDDDAAVAFLQQLEPVFDGSEDAREFYAFAADFYAAHSRHERAAFAYEKLLKLAKGGPSASDAERQRWQAGLVKAAARADPAAAVRHAQALPASSALHVDPSSAPAAGPSVGEMAEAGLRRPTARAEGAVVIKPARKRPMRRPTKASVDAAAGKSSAAAAEPLDPERWVPIKERTYIRDLPSRRQRELRRRRAADQEDKRRQAERRKRDAAAAAAKPAAAAE